ncbi:MAG: cytochrome c oxidase subunit II [Polyangiaceae bacterium]|nr:cytochrome c oxidase subunit II [Polyangiaceae bacterium]
MSQGATTKTPTATTAQPAGTAAPQEAQYTIQPDEGYWLPRQNGAYSEQFDWAWSFYIWVCVIFFVIVIGPMTYFAFKYKRKSETEKTSPIDHHLQLEIVWTAIPTALLMYMFWVGFKLYADTQIAPNDAMTVQVTGAMYNWKFQYPDGTVTQELELPKDRPVKLVLSSVDTIHSFFVPEFRLKADVVPNLYTTMWFHPTKETDTAVQCAEYCGNGHSTMYSRVLVMPSGDAGAEGTFENWLANGGEKSSLSPLALGTKKYGQLCKSCHTLDGSKSVGPSFKGLFGKTESLADGSTVTVDENYIKESIVNPGAKIVQGYQNQMPSMAYLKDKDIEGIITFIKEQK